MSKKICPVCGYQDEGNASYCRECGAKMTESGDDAWSAYEQRGQYSGYQDNTSQTTFNAGSGQNGQYSGYQDNTSQTTFNAGSGQNRQYSGYQDYTSNIPYQHIPDNFEPDSGANGLQIAGLVCGILAICSCCCYGLPAIILGIAGLICASMGNKTSKNGMGVAGIVCSVIGLILGAIATVYYAMTINQLIQMNYMDDIFDML